MVSVVFCFIFVCLFNVITQPSNKELQLKNYINLSVKALMLCNASGCHDVYFDLKRCSASFYANTVE